MVAELRELGNPDLVVAALFFLLVAGQETTSQFLTLLMHRLTGSPAILDGLVDGSVDVDDVVEEGLRLVPPITTWRRVAAAGTMLDGVSIPAGSSILWLVQAGKRAGVLVAVLLAVERVQIERVHEVRVCLHPCGMVDVRRLQGGRARLGSWRGPGRAVGHNGPVSEAGDQRLTPGPDPGRPLAGCACTRPERVAAR